MVGRPKGAKSFAAMLNIAINQAGEHPGETKLRDIADVLVNKAVGGDIQAIKEIADRLDGKVPQAVIGDEENPLQVIHAITRTIISAKNARNSDG